MKNTRIYTVLILLLGLALQVSAVSAALYSASATAVESGESNANMPNANIPNANIKSSASNAAMPSNASNLSSESNATNKALQSNASNTTVQPNASNTNVASGTTGQADLSVGSNTTIVSGDDYLNVTINQVESFPWYTSEETFYTRTYSETTFLPFKEYYLTTGTTIVGGIISNPVVFDITERTPTIVYYGAGTALPYSQYVSTMPSNTNDLWIQGTSNWTQYAVVPVGTWLQLVANAPVGGATGFYEVVQTETQTVDYSVYQLNSGYSTMSFQADAVGRHMVYFVVNNQPSNLVVVDVFEAAP